MKAAKKLRVEALPSLCASPRQEFVDACLFLV